MNVRRVRYTGSITHRSRARSWLQYKLYRTVSSRYFAYLQRCRYVAASRTCVTMHLSLFYISSTQEALREMGCRL